MMYTDAVREIRGKWETVRFHSRMPILPPENEPIGQVYQRGRDALERHLREKLLPSLEAGNEEERRRYRLHRRDVRVSYLVEGEVMQGKYLSLTLTVERSIGEERNQTVSHRVWDLEKNSLCPIDRFVRRKGNSPRWEYRLNDSLLGCPRPLS